MSSFIMLKNVILNFGERAILDNINFTLDSNSRIALVGINGSGKSTLMKVLMGLQAIDDGELSYSPNCRIGYMSQSMDHDLSKSLYELAESGYSYYFNLETEIAKLDNIADEKSLIKRDEIQQILIDNQFYDRASSIDMVLTGLGFKKNDFHKLLSTFSNGWRILANLARVLLQNPDILLLDEPSNYLDMEASSFLIDYLKRFKGGILLVSHDRYFLDQTTRQTLELFNGKAKMYSFKYSDYEIKREQELQLLLSQKEAQDDRVKQIEDFASKYRASANKAKQVQSRLKELEKMDLIDIPSSFKKLSINFPSPPHCGERVFYAENIYKNYGDKKVLNNLSFLLNKGEKLALVGQNGAGKSTLMRLIAGIETPSHGFTRLGVGVQIGYFSEDTHQPFKGSTVEEELSLSASLSMQPYVRNLLAGFLFRGDDAYKLVDSLSGGEKARLLLARLFLSPFNLLLLDEPTNHLDLAAKDALLEALQKYNGSVIFVSHDRYFIDNLASCVLSVGLESKYYNGGYDYYLEQINNIVPLEKLPKAIKNITTNQLLHEENKKQKAENRRKDKEIDMVLEEINQLEVIQANLEEELSSYEIYSDGEKTKSHLIQIEQCKDRISCLYVKWEELSLE